MYYVKIKIPAYVYVGNKHVTMDTEYTEQTKESVLMVIIILFRTVGHGP